MNSPIPEVKEHPVNRFLAAKVTRKASLVGLELLISKLSVASVLEIQEAARAIEALPKEEHEAAHFGIICLTVRAGAEELKDMPDSELKELPLDELSELSNQIMQFSGLTQKPAQVAK